MKTYGFQISSNIIKYSSSIRNKSDIINILIGIIRFFYITSPVNFEDLIIKDNPDEIILIVHIDKMSRIFISEKNKIHTFHFPFNLIISDQKIKIYYNGYEIDNGTLSVLSATFKDLEDCQSIEQIIENYWSIIGDFEINSKETQIYNSLITYLLSFEPGYLRFDYDEKHTPDELHPLNHLDFYYTNKTTFKVGLQNKINHIQLIDILNASTPCLTLR